MWFVLFLLMCLLYFWRVLCLFVSEVGCYIVCLFACSLLGVFGFFVLVCRCFVLGLVFDFVDLSCFVMEL